MNNGLPLQNALLAAATAINASGGVAFYLDMRAGPTDGCGGHPGVQGHQAMFKAAVPIISSSMNWQFDLVPGFIAEGNDVIAPIANLSLSNAQNKCLNTPGCAAITFSAESANPQLISLTYFKNVTGTQPGTSWFSYVNLGVVA